MKITVRIKKAGSRKVLENTVYESKQDIRSLRDLLCFLVKEEVEKYNARNSENPMLKYLTEKNIEETAESGKVGFGYTYSGKKADLDKAIENALQCYKDGLVRVFKNDEELLELNDKLVISDSDEFTLIRMVFLAGRMW